MPGSINGQPLKQANPSAVLLSELAEMARSHDRMTRNTYHGVYSSASASAATSPHANSTGNSPMQSSSVPTTPLVVPGTPGTPRSVSDVESATKSYSSGGSLHRVASPKAQKPVLSSAAGAGAPASAAVGQTDVDKMMLLVQAQHKSLEGSAKPKDSAKNVFVCSVEGCGKQFRQRAHLHTHMRSHTGERPFVCPFEGCHKFFSQRCNLRTHIRSHTGERPFKCDICGRAFSQQGNMRHHQLIHYNDHPLICKLENCFKRFNQLGNLKAHQNSAHKDMVHRFTERLQSGATINDLPADEREIFDYFCDLYKNSNRGIRGRGKGTKTIAFRHNQFASSPESSSGTPSLTSSPYVSPNGATPVYESDQRYLGAPLPPSYTAQPLFQPSHAQLSQQLPHQVSPPQVSPPQITPQQVASQHVPPHMAPQRQAQNQIPQHQIPQHHVQQYQAQHQGLPHHVQQFQQQPQQQPQQHQRRPLDQQMPQGQNGAPKQEAPMHMNTQFQPDHMGQANLGPSGQVLDAEPGNQPQQHSQGRLSIPDLLLPNSVPFNQHLRDMSLFATYPNPTQGKGIQQPPLMQDPLQHIPASEQSTNDGLNPHLKEHEKERLGSQSQPINEPHSQPPVDLAGASLNAQYKTPQELQGSGNNSNSSNNSALAGKLLPHGQPDTVQNGPCDMPTNQRGREASLQFLSGFFTMPAQV